MGRSSQFLNSLSGGSSLIGCTGSTVGFLKGNAASEFVVVSSVVSSLQPSDLSSFASPSPDDSGAGVGCVVEIMGVSPSTSQVSSFNTSCSFSGAGDDSGGCELTGSGPSGLARGSLFKYCLRRVACQLSGLGYAR